MQEKINACSTVEELEALYVYTNTGTEEKPVYTRPMGEWPEAPDQQ